MKYIYFGADPVGLDGKVECFYHMMKQKKYDRIGEQHGDCYKCIPDADNNKYCVGYKRAVVYDRDHR
jgi:hypothetical protein